MDLVHKLHAWHQTKKGLASFAVVELLVAYIFLSIAIDTANLWSYTVGVLAAVGAIHNVLRIVGVRKKSAKKRR